MRNKRQRKQNKRIKQLKMCLPREEQSNDVQKQSKKQKKTNKKKKQIEIAVCIDVQLGSESTSCIQFSGIERIYLLPLRFE